MQLIVLTGFLLISSGWNARFGTIPNWLVVAFFVAFFPTAWIGKLPVEDIGLAVAIFALALLVVIIMHASDFLAGGTAKLIAVTSMWLGATYGGVFLVVCGTVAGGVEMLSRAFESRTLDLLNRHQATWVALIGLSFAALLSRYAAALFCGSLTSTCA